MIKNIQQSIKKCLLLMILGSVSFDILSDDVTLVVKGIGDSKATAIIDAQRNALRASYGEFVSNNLTTLDNELTKNETVNLVSGTIQDSKLLSESEDDFSVPPIIEVLMKITVNKGKLVSFAKAIGDNVEIQGSLFGAEIKQQEINKNNELTAMEHLAKKAETMSTFFDYEITVQSPKRSPVIQDEYFIYSSMSLTTNQNYKNLTSTVLNTLSQVAMKPDEIEKYKELGTPLYRLDVINIQNPICYRLRALGLDSMWGKYPNLTAWNNTTSTLEQVRYKLENSDYLFDYDWKNRKDKSDITKQRGVTVEINSFNHAEITCNAGKVDRFYLRSKDSYSNFEKIRQQVEKSIVRYEVSRKTRTDSKLIFPFSFTSSSIGEIGDPPFKYHDDRAGNIFHDEKSLMLKERVLERQTEEDKNKVSNKCVDELWPMGEITICYKDTEYTEFAKDVTRIYDYHNYRPTLRVGYYDDGGWFNDPRFFSPLTVDDLNSICQSRTIQAEYTKEQAEDLCEKDNRAPAKRRRSRPVIFTAMLSRMSPVFLYYQKLGGQDTFGSFFIFPQEYKFSVLNYEDVVDTQKLSAITGYVVDPDKLTKR
ncbi:MAG: hypothetical protein CMD57_02600 [Gammaproteobacteria bacterium]|nr:hypothetical protein [Gammaproteobacteria bacterium]